ncbi:TetR/AcrR family transcriptional regulator [Actinomycetaceae bacterium MB13-C1-2]|nr:TetR/AcrR family transcriptional regulator [Actinomycetaceae bacterium MB13-C1-2]
MPRREFSEHPGERYSRSQRGITRNPEGRTEGQMTMPRIQAATVAEHHANVEARLIDAAESLLRADPHSQLTAGKVSGQAGIARTSIYRYVESVDDLVGLVIARHLPTWIQAVNDATTSAGSDPIDNLVAWTGANIEQAALTGHAWLMEAARARPSRHSEEASRGAHGALEMSLLALWKRIVGDEEQRKAATLITNGIIESGFRLLEGGMDPDIVCEVSCRAVRGLALEMTD